MPYKIWWYIGLAHLPNDHCYTDSSIKIIFLTCYSAILPAFLPMSIGFSTNPNGICSQSHWSERLTISQSYKTSALMSHEVCCRLLTLLRTCNPSETKKKKNTRVASTVDSDRFCAGRHVGLAFSQPQRPRRGAIKGKCCAFLWSRPRRMISSVLDWNTNLIIGLG